jgi:hypothetical protein
VNGRLFETLKFWFGSFRRTTVSPARPSEAGRDPLLLDLDYAACSLRGSPSSILTKGMTIVAADEQIAKYEVRTIW